MIANASVELVVVCDSDGAVRSVLHDALGLCEASPVTFAALIEPASRPRAHAFLAELAARGAPVACELALARGGAVDQLRFAGCAFVTGYCIVAARGNAAFGLSEALDEIMQIVNEQCNTIRSIVLHKSDADRSARGRSDEQFAEVARLNNELVAAQRGLTQHNAQLQRALSELERARATATAQRDEIERINGDLARSNEALQRFAFVVAHDLKAPLRSIRCFIEMFHENNQRDLDDRTRSWIDHIVQGARRMDRLVTDTLAFARVGREAAPPEQVDLSQVVDAQRVTFMDALAASGGELVRDPLPVLCGNRTQLEQLVQNLIQNALVHRAAAPPRIHVAAQRVAGAWQISVRDNGVGVAPEDRQAVFELLHRGAASGERSGTGLGLAICRQIVRQHDGEIWVEAAPGGGSAFCFTIPDPKPPA